MHSHPQRVRAHELKSPSIVRLLGGAPRIATNDEDLTPDDLAQIDAAFAAGERDDDLTRAHQQRGMGWEQPR